MKLIQNTLLSTVAFMFISCGDNTTVPLKDITSLKINESNVTIYSTDADSDESRLTANVYFNDGTNDDATNELVWSSSDTTIATIKQGKISVGTTNGGDINITVSHKDLYSEPILFHIRKLLDYNITLLDSDANSTGTYELLAEGIFEDNTTHTVRKNITWESNNSSIITIEEEKSEIEITTTGDTNITSKLFNDDNMTKTIIYRVN